MVAQCLKVLMNGCINKIDVVLTFLVFGLYTGKYVGRISSCDSCMQPEHCLAGQADSICCYVDFTSVVYFCSKSRSVSLSLD